MIECFFLCVAEYDTSESLSLCLSASVILCCCADCFLPGGRRPECWPDMDVPEYLDLDEIDFSDDLAVSQI